MKFYRLSIDDNIRFLQDITEHPFMKKYLPREARGWKESELADCFAQLAAYPNGVSCVPKMPEPNAFAVFLDSVPIQKMPVQTADYHCNSDKHSI